MSIPGGTRELPAGRAHSRGVSEPPAATAANASDTSQPRAAAPRMGGGLSVYMSARPQATHPPRSSPFRAEEGCDGRTGTPEKKPRASPFLLPPGSQILDPGSQSPSPPLTSPLLSGLGSRWRPAFPALPGRSAGGKATPRAVDVPNAESADGESSGMKPF